MGSCVTNVMGFLPVTFQLRMPFRSQLMVRHGTDRLTESSLCLRRGLVWNISPFLHSGRGMGSVLQDQWHCNAVHDMTIPLCNYAVQKQISNTYFDFTHADVSGVSIKKT